MHEYLFNSRKAKSNNSILVIIFSVIKPSIFIFLLRPFHVQVAANSTSNISSRTLYACSLLVFPPLSKTYSSCDIIQIDKII